MTETEIVGSETLAYKDALKTKAPAQVYFWGTG
jgi:hypothetical protein